MDTKSIIVGVGITLLVVGGIGGVMFGITQMDDSPINQTKTPTPDKSVNESDVPQQVIDSKPGAVALKESFTGEYNHENNVTIQSDGNIIVTYTSSAQNGNQLKDEMKDIALLYSDVAAEHPSMGSLMIRANGIILTVPEDTAIAHGNGDINEEAYLENIRFESEE